MKSATDIIVAGSSAPGRSVRALVRCSGKRLDRWIPDILDMPPPPRTARGCRLRWVEGGGVRELAVLATYLPGPRSFTGEDVLEVELPGNPVLVGRVLVGLTGDGRARLAEAGEFTRRAFLGGRLDLTRAEGIAATIGAVSDAQLQAAALLRGGRLGEWAGGLVRGLGRLLALVEAGIDFVDQEGVVTISPRELDEGLEAVEGELEGLLGRSRSWSVLEGLPWVVLAGEPNVGKSTLFNALLGQSRAVTSAIAGTTRDVLVEPLRIATTDHDQAEVMLVDIAGLEEAGAGLGGQMQEAARAALERAELILHLHTSDGGPVARPELGGLRAKVLRVRAKSDEVSVERRRAGPGVAGLYVSGQSGEGLEDLRGAIGEALRQRAVSVGGEALALQPRHEGAIRAALGHVGEARAMVVPMLEAGELAGPELVAEPLRAALDEMAGLGGAMTPDEVIGQVFARFCVGK